MIKCKYKGSLLEAKLPEECGHTGYLVECRYKYNKNKEKYELSMWLKHNNILDTRFKIDYQEIDTQYINSSKDTIQDNIGRIIEQASLSGFFEKYIREYEYTYQCYVRGRKLLENESKEIVNA